MMLFSFGHTRVKSVDDVDDFELSRLDFSADISVKLDGPHRPSVIFIIFAPSFADVT